MLGGCADQPLTVTREPVAYQLVAAESCASLAHELAAAYEHTYPWVTLEVQVLNTALATRALAAGEADVALVPWLDEQAGASGVWTTPVARLGVAVVANDSLPLHDLRLGHLYEMYRGRLQEWDGHVLVIVSREEGSGTRALFEAGVLRGREMSALTAVMLPTSRAVLDFVAATPDAIGYVATTVLSGSLPANVHVVAVEGVPPTREALADGRYPLAGSLHLATVGEPAGPLRDFAQWVLSPPGQAIIARYGNW
jgi:phosphate transport system substrate-binding protein